MTTALASVGLFPVIPQLSVLFSRQCADAEEVNCFASINGCQNMSLPDETLRCNDPAGWSLSLVFVGTGAEFPSNSNCNSTSCKWSIDNIECGWPSFDWLGPVVYAEGLSEGKHTLTISSTPEHSAMLTIVYATIHTALDTPVHAEDDIWIPASSSMFEYQGDWREVEPEDDDESSVIPPNSRMRELVDGAGSVSLGVIADRFHLRNRVLEVLADAQTFANWIVSVNGDPDQETFGPLESVPQPAGGWYNVSLHSRRPAYTERPLRVGFAGLSYHPLSNVSRIRDVTPAYLVEAVGGFDYSKLVGADTQCKERDADADDSEGGAPGGARWTVGIMGLVWGVFAGYGVWC